MIDHRIAILIGLSNYGGMRDHTLSQLHTGIINLALKIRGCFDYIYIISNNSEKDNYIISNNSEKDNTSRNKIKFLTVSDFEKLISTIKGVIDDLPKLGRNTFICMAEKHQMVFGSCFFRTQVL